MVSTIVQTILYNQPSFVIKVTRGIILECTFTTVFEIIGYASLDLKMTECFDYRSIKVFVSTEIVPFFRLNVFDRHYRLEKNSFV